MATQKLKFYLSTILNPQNDKTCDYYPQGMLVVEGMHIKDILKLEEGVKKYARKMHRNNTFDLGETMIIPGFFDMHFHWVQDDVREMPKDSLLEWLKLYTFPTEMKFKNKAYTKKRARDFFKKLLNLGTMGGAIYGSIHEQTVDEALKRAKGHFVVGNVLMNMNSPDELTQTEEESIKLTRKLIARHGKKHCFTPRFAITTTPRVMKEGSQMADRAGCFKQSHLSETKAEIDFVMSIYRKLPGFEKVKNYTEIYHKSGMLGKRSIMGHGIYLSQQELKLLHQTGTSIAHCPTSNAPLKEQGLGSGIFDFKRTERAKVRWALGSDIGGGPFGSMFDVMRSFVEQNQGKRGASYVKALYRATLAGAEIMGLSSKTGNLNKGKEANFIVVNLPSSVLPASAEELLRLVITPYQKQRKEYLKLVKKVCYLGKF